MMRAVALAGRRAALQTRASVSTAPLCRFLSSGGREPPSNPFEIDLSLSSTSSTATTLSLDDAKRAAEGQQAEAQREIELLHREMSSLFGEEVAEPSSSGSSSGVEAAFDMEVAGESSAVESGESSVGAVEEAPGVTSKPAVKDQPKKRKTARQKKALGAGMAEERSSQTATKESSTAVGEVDDRPPSVLVVMGPCSVMQGFWTGGNILLSELRSQVRTQSDELKIKSKMRVSNVESDVLELILKAQPDQVVVLGWNISLSKSPFVLHALELIKASVIIVSPNGVDHGPLPSNVVGVLAVHVDGRSRRIQTGVEVGIR
ncbi:hypothetical protein PHYBOEH_006078 [Phytophthora boehmeriae]|uniref:Uncharacterized protein n=1 Tax=Phytophthora boehmeriae TaxID=109152 RepID=A0A8T1WNF6_9STRA|nr:hypothetical protein PHYBOEH_006078 [Phytophthora boehmeriae]